MTHPNDPDQHRCFCLAEAIVLVAATACGFSLRPTHWTGSELIPVVFNDERIRLGLQAWDDELAPILGSWTPALLTLRKPRPFPLAGNPGLAVLWGVSIGLLVHMLEVGVHAAKLRLGLGLHWFRVTRDLYAVETAVRLLVSERCVQAPAVAAIVALCLHAIGDRRWIATGWLNRAGSILGICWIALMVMLWFL